VHENVFAPVVGGDVARAFRLVEPLDLPLRWVVAGVELMVVVVVAVFERVGFVRLFVGVLEWMT
jgi:hypothetical protein